MQLWQPSRGAEESGDQRDCVTGCHPRGPREADASLASMPLLLPCSWTVKEAIRVVVSQRLEITSDESVSHVALVHGVTPMRHACP